MNKRKPRKKAEKPVDWSKAFAKALERERDADALRAVELIRELHWLVIIKHGKAEKYALPKRKRG